MMRHSFGMKLKEDQKLLVMTKMVFIFQHAKNVVLQPRNLTKEDASERGSL